MNNEKNMWKDYEELVKTYDILMSPHFIPKDLKGVDSLFPPKHLISNKVCLMLGDVFGTQTITPINMKYPVPDPSILNRYPQLLSFYKDGIVDVMSSDRLLIQIGAFHAVFTKSPIKPALVCGLDNYFEKGEFIKVQIESLYPSVIHKHGLIGQKTAVNLFNSRYDRKFDNYLYGAISLNESKMYDETCQQYISHMASMYMMALISALEDIAELIHVNTDTILFRPTVEMSVVQNALRMYYEKTGLRPSYIPFKAIYQRKRKEYIIIYHNDEYQIVGLRNSSKIKKEDMYNV